jgi:hypothetical protein
MAEHSYFSSDEEAIKLSASFKAVLFSLELPDRTVKLIKLSENGTQLVSLLHTCLYLSVGCSVAVEANLLGGISFPHSFFKHPMALSLFSPAPGCAKVCHVVLLPNRPSKPEAQCSPQRQNGRAVTSAVYPSAEIMDGVCQRWTSKTEWQYANNHPLELGMGMIK